MSVTLWREVDNHREMIMGQEARPLVTVKTAAKVLEYTHNLSAPVLPSRKRMLALIVQFDDCIASHVVYGRPKQGKADSVDGYRNRRGRRNGQKSLNVSEQKSGSGSVLSIAQRRHFVSEELHGDDGVVVVATCESSPAKSLSALLSDSPSAPISWDGSLKINTTRLRSR